ncbi:phosphoketolase [Nocardia puris]|uniref:phosphoketolase n=1 Tax=Nocardia puris TaxID=208602 RepID=UPI00189481AB|nr:phosphoketolase [Nocardia puris]MBF6215872.1 phosphoketolase [Nocardia puris]
MTTDWTTHVAAASASATTPEVDTARRALDYLCLAQLYLRTNITLSAPLRPDHVKPHPAGHWGVCPPVNAVLAALGPYRRLPGVDVRVVHGGGHAGPSALAQAWITGALDTGAEPFGHHDDGLRRLCAQFPRTRFGGEITPLIPGHDHLGGQLGPALAIAHGMGLDAPDRLVVALIGDGECETGATAAAWLGARALIGTGTHGRVLPVILANGLRMGSASLLAGLDPADLAHHLGGLGYQVITAGPATHEITAALARAMTGLRPVQYGPSTVVVVTVDKGHGVPKTVAGQQVAQTPRVHKVPLRNPRADNAEFVALERWLSGYRPQELFTGGAPTATVCRVLAPAATSRVELHAPRGCIAAASAVADRVASADFGAAITTTLRELNTVYGLRVFSPDELASNRIELGATESGWTIEVLNEELCHAWAQGYQATGRRGVVVGYEAFAPITASLLAQQLLAHRLAAAAGRPPGPSLVYLLTSLGWHNTITHANPGLIDIAIGAADPSVHIYLPADAARTAAALTFAVRKLGRASLVIASKHPMPAHPHTTIDAELRDGYAVWPHIAADPDPEMVLVSIGDIAARELTRAATAITATRPAARLRYLHIHDLTSLGAPGHRDAAISAADFERLFPPGAAILIATTCHPAAVHALLGERGAPRTVIVRGWANPPRPMSHDELLDHTGIAATSLHEAALALLDSTIGDPLIRQGAR